MFGVSTILLKISSNCITGGFLYPKHYLHPRDSDSNTMRRVFRFPMILLKKMSNGVTAVLNTRYIHYRRARDSDF